MQTRSVLLKILVARKKCVYDRPHIHIHTFSQQLIPTYKTAYFVLLVWGAGLGDSTRVS